MAKHTSASRTGRTSHGQSDTPQEVDQLLLRNRDVAQLICVSESHLHELKQTGRFGPTPIRLGRAVRYSKNELVAWLQHGAPSRSQWRAMAASKSK